MSSKRSSVFITIIVAGLMLSGYAGLSEAASLTPKESKRGHIQVAKDFVSAVTKGDTTKVEKMGSKDFIAKLNAQGGSARLASEWRKGVDERGEYTITSVEKEQITGNTAYVAFKSIRSKETHPGTDTFFLVKENGDWKINGFKW